MSQLVVSGGVQVTAQLKQSSTTAKIRDTLPKTNTRWALSYKWSYGAL